jgi:DNA polymerase V
MFALADCNNFYVSCERIFNPALRRRPVVVLSNNDGCVIARSEEAKACGVKMGAPYFQIAPLVDMKDIAVFSSNYCLYGDMSSRVMEAFNLLAPEVENYSIDEAFLKLDGRPRNLIEKGTRIKEKIYRWTGIPISIGIGPNKTLAKIANRFAKKKNLGVFDLVNENVKDEVLRQMAVGDIWGIGYRSAKKLSEVGIQTAYDLRNMDGRWARKMLSVTGARIALELKGEVCLPLELMPPPKKSICCSRSFGQSVAPFEVLLEALYAYLNRATEKMRKQNLSANAVTVFLATNRFAHDEQYSNSLTIELANPSNSTLELREWTRKALTKIFKAGYLYKKVGVILQGLQSEPLETVRLHDEPGYLKDKKLMTALDAINTKFGRDTVRFGAERYREKWKMRSEMKSSRYTSDINEVLTIDI